MKAKLHYIDIFLVSPELSLILIICIFTIFGLVYEKSKHHTKLASVLANLASIVLVFTIIGFWYGIAYFDNAGKKSILIGSQLFANSLEFSKFSYFNKIVCVFLAILCMLSSKTYFEHKRFYYFEIIILILIILLAGLILIAGRDLLIFYIGIEVISLSLYVLISMKKNEIQAIEAGLKYFILGSISSACLVFGSAWLYYLTGTTNLVEITMLTPYFDSRETIKFTIGSFFILVGLFYKLSLFPFHYWIGDVYEGAPTPVVLIMSTLAKYPLVIVMIKLNFYLFIFTAEAFQQAMIVSAGLTIAIGSFYAFGQKRVKRLMAYGSMIHSGLILANSYTCMFGGYQTSIEYSIIYMITTIGFFNFLMSIYKGKDKKMLLSLDDYKGMSRQRPLLSVTFGIIILSFMGIPPFFGFFAKYYALWHLVSRLAFGWMMVIALLLLISAVYYFRFIKNIFFDLEEPKISEPYTLWTDYVGLLSYAVCLFFIIFGFFFLGPVDTYLNKNIALFLRHLWA